MRYILTYTDANNNKQIRFFRTLSETKKYMNLLRENGSCPYYNFKIKIVKPY
jgi:hypothetical protein